MVVALCDTFRKVTQVKAETTEHFRKNGLFPPSCYAPLWAAKAKANPVSYAIQAKAHTHHI